jgi:hypothetical protein
VGTERKSQRVATVEAVPDGEARKSGRVAAERRSGEVMTEVEVKVGHTYS